ncbi:MAG: hypothetical protein ABFD18_09340 [Syntrophomonas sp.]
MACDINTKYLGLPVSIMETNEYRKLKDIAARRSIQVIPLRTGQFINLEEGMEITVLHPELMMRIKN